MVVSPNEICIARLASEDTKLVAGWTSEIQRKSKSETHETPAHGLYLPCNLQFRHPVRVFEALSILARISRI